MKLFILIGIILIILAIPCIVAIFQMLDQVPKKEKDSFFWSIITCVTSLFFILFIGACLCFNRAKEEYNKSNKIVDSTYVILNENAEKSCDE